MGVDPRNHLYAPGLCLNLSASPTLPLTHHPGLHPEPETSIRNQDPKPGRRTVNSRRPERARNVKPQFTGYLKNKLTTHIKNQPFPDVAAHHHHRLHPGWVLGFGFRVQAPGFRGLGLGGGIWACEEREGV